MRFLTGDLCLHTNWFVNIIHRLCNYYHNHQNNCHRIEKSGRVEGKEVDWVIISNTRYLKRLEN